MLVKMTITTMMIYNATCLWFSLRLFLKEQVFHCVRCFLVYLIKPVNSKLPARRL